MAPIPRQSFNGQEVQKIYGYRLRFGNWNVTSICRRGTEVCEELRKRKVDVCSIQEVRWRGYGAQFLTVEKRRFKL